MFEFKPPELDLFTLRPVQTSIVNDQLIGFNCQTTLDNCTNIEFIANSYHDKYIDLNNIFLKLQFNVVKSDDKLFTSTDSNQPFFVNNGLHSMFKGLTIQFNNQVVSKTNMYHYKSYLENLLNFEKHRADTIMQTQLWALDTGGHLEEGISQNAGGKTRFGKTQNSKTCELYGKLNSDVFNVSKLLISDVNLKVALELEKNEFFLMDVGSTKVAKIKIQEAQLFVRYCTISPTVLLEHHKLLNTRNINYDFKRNLMKHFIIPKGVSGQNFENLFTGPLPSKILLGFVENEAFNGSLAKNPFNFQHFYISQIQYNVNGNFVPSTPLTLNPNSGLVAKAYHDLYQGLNIHLKNVSLQLTEYSFRSGFLLFCTDFTPTKRDNVLNLTDHGIMKLDVKFDKPLESSLVMIVYSEFNDSFEITANKNIITRY